MSSVVRYCGVYGWGDAKTDLVERTITTIEDELKSSVGPIAEAGDRGKVKRETSGTFSCCLEEGNGLGEVVKASRVRSICDDDTNYEGKVSQN